MRQLWPAARTLSSVARAAAQTRGATRNPLRGSDPENLRQELEHRAHARVLLQVGVHGLPDHARLGRGRGRDPEELRLAIGDGAGQERDARAGTVAE